MCGSGGAGGGGKEYAEVCYGWMVLDFNVHDWVEEAKRPSRARQDDGKTGDHLIFLLESCQGTDSRRKQG